MKSSSTFSLDKITASEILNGVPHGIAILDTDLRIVEMNGFLEVLTGFSNSDARGVDADFIIRSKIEDKSRQFRKVLETKQNLSVTGDILNQHHKKIPVHFTLSTLRDKFGTVAGLLVFLEDVSAQQSFDMKRLSPEAVDNILGHSPKMQEMFELLPLLAHTDASILITGETGTGKDMIAEAIHKTSKRSRRPFIKVNCGALPEALLESELFGHVRGAFTGAVKDKPGLFRLAQDGTIFLTEIGDLPLALQVKLLSFLDDKEFFPVGGVKKVQVNVRIIAATHRPLRALVNRGEFREDLFYRLNVLRLHLPPLREREGDIRLLLDHFLRKFNSGLNKNIQSFNSKSIDILTSYAYPGNVRELRNIVEYAVNICQGTKVQRKCLPRYLFSPAEVLKKPEPSDQETYITAKTPQEEQSDTAETKTARRTGGWQAVEKEMILEALKKSRGNRSQAARTLGWGRTTLWRKLNRHGLT
ncbi:MAG: sigma 54-interacting transcriptional regulator [Thermodesulfobacteriota bacterium]|nr:sigma 54-interacting transcriptional regulator [Thermodesulfobacteriota bacterium]